MELFKLFGTIALNGVEETHSALDGVTEKASGIGSKIASGVGTVAKTVGKTAVAAVAATTTAVAAIGKSAVQSYAEYEQLVGGVDTLFKDSSKKVQGYADQAYKTAGMSANNYMETVTSFSASLLQGLSGDTEAAAEIANMAIIDMADNANKMGTDMASIQNAYQGFAKKNYTMLDNLKLGYGGTASEMARLVNESGVLGEAITVTAETINDVSFDKIIEAIHTVQEEMGIAGTTAKEAASTISGSLSSVRGAWSNLLTGMASDDADMSQLISNLTSSIETAASNLLPRITETISGIGEATVQLAPFLVESVTKLVKDVAPDLLESGAELANTLLDSFANSLIDTSPILAPIGEMILNVKESLSDAFSTIGESIDWDSVFSGLQGALEVACGLVEDLAQGFEDFVTYATTEGTPLNDAFSSIKTAASEVVQWFKDNWGDIETTMSGTGEKIKGAGEEICTAFSNIVNEISKNDGIKTELTWIKDNVFAPLAESMGEIAQFSGSVASGIGNIITELIRMGRDEKSTIGAAINMIKIDLAAAFEDLKLKIQGTCQVLTGDFAGAWETTKTRVLNVIDEWKAKIDTLNGAIQNAIASLSEYRTSHENLSFDSDNTTSGSGTGGGGTTEGGGTGRQNASAKAGQNGAGRKAVKPELYASGGVLKEPTAFALNPYTGKTMIGGEAGPEAIAPIDVLQGYVSEAVEAETRGMNDTLNRILDALVMMNDNMGANMREAMEGVSLRMNNRELARAVKGVV